MQKLQDVFERIQKTKKKQSEIRTSYREALSKVKKYSEVMEELKKLKAEKKQIEDSVKLDFEKDFEQLESYKLDLEADNEMMSDIALNNLVQGKNITIKDEQDNEFEPVFSVRFRKSFS